MTTVLSILVLISSITLIVLTLISEPAENNMAAIMGGGASESFWEGNKGNSKEAIINRVNIIAAIVLAVSLILLARA